MCEQCTSGIAKTRWPSWPFIPATSLPELEIGRSIVVARVIERLACCFGQLYKIVAIYTEIGSLVSLVVGYIVDLLFSRTCDVKISLHPFRLEVNDVET